MRRLFKGASQVTALFLLLFLSPAVWQTVLAATLEISPSSGTLNKGCVYTFDIILDTKGAATDGTDAIFFYEPAKFTSNTNAITKGTLYPEYIGNSVDNSTGRVFISGLAPYTAPYTGRGTFAKIDLTVKSDAAAGATTLNFDFKLNESIDSNVAKRDEGDILTAVTNGNYTIGTGSCTSTGGSSTTTPSSLPQTGQSSTSSAQQGGTLDDITGDGKSSGTAEFTYMLTIVGFTLTVLGVIGFAIL